MDKNHEIQSGSELSSQDKVKKLQMVLMGESQEDSNEEQKRDATKHESLMRQLQKTHQKVLSASVKRHQSIVKDLKEQIQREEKRFKLELEQLEETHEMQKLRISLNRLALKQRERETKNRYQNEKQASSANSQKKDNQKKKVGKIVKASINYDKFQEVFKEKSINRLENQEQQNFKSDSSLAKYIEGITQLSQEMRKKSRDFLRAYHKQKVVQKINIE